MKLLYKIASGSVLAATFFTVAATAGAATVTINPFADAFLATGSANNPSGNLTADNFGGGGALVLAAPNLPSLPNGEFQTVLKFDLSSVTSSFNTQFGAGNWAIQSITLQLTATPHGNAIYNSPAAGNFDVSLMQNNSWTEGTGTAGIPTSDGISYNTLQSTYINNAVDQGLGTFNFPGGTSGATTSLLTLTSGLVADVNSGSDLSLRLFATSADTTSFLFSSRSDSGVPNRPELIITATPEPGTLALGGLGIAALSLWGRNRRSRN